MTEPFVSQTEIDELTARFKDRVKSIFEPFDRSRNGCCDERELGSILKALGLAPTEEEVVQLLQDCREDEPSSYLLFDKVEPVLINALLDHHLKAMYKFPSEDELLQAFYVFDPDRKGFIDSNILREKLLSEGEPFRGKEMEDFLSFADSSGIIDYRSYVQKI
ncbi:hypothetical protein GEMRC1_007436 [Eukaryota sp. GEM-RC1]